MKCHLAAAGLLAFFSALGGAMAGECPGNPDALGTSRTVSVDSVALKRVGTIQYPETLPLEDHEVVLTFDDGPIPPNTDRVLDALAAECVKATFFIVGQEATAHPAPLQRALREGHTIGTHTQHHARLHRLSAEKAAKEIDDGIASVRAVLGDAGAPAPFFRIPYFDRASVAEAYAARQGISVWNSDVNSNDWTRLKPEQIVALTMKRLERPKKGIILLHDIHARTVLALPLLLKELKKDGYKIVHAVPAAPKEALVARAEPKPEMTAPKETQGPRAEAKPEMAAPKETQEVRAEAKPEMAEPKETQEVRAEAKPEMAEPKETQEVRAEAKPEMAAPKETQEVRAEAKPEMAAPKETEARTEAKLEPAGALTLSQSEGLPNY